MLRERPRPMVQSGDDPAKRAEDAVRVHIDSLICPCGPARPWALTV